MPRRYKVSVTDFRLREELRSPDIKIVWAYDAKDAFNQVDCLIDRLYQHRDEKVTKIEPYPPTLIEKIKLICR